MKIRILEDVKTDLTEEEIIENIPKDLDPIGISEIKVNNYLVRFFLHKEEIVVMEAKPLPEEGVTHNKEFIKRAFNKAIADSIKEDNSQNDKKLIYWGVKYLPIADTSVEMKGKIISLIKLLMKSITYREFMNLFPIAKEYDGGDDWKDYYYTIDYLKDFDLDDLIDDPLELLMEYNNHDIMFFNVEFMEVTSDLSRERLGVDPFIEFFYPEEYAHDSKGNVIGVTADGKVHKIASPEKSILKIVK